jgi:hypothetical protein
MFQCDYPLNDSYQKGPGQNDENKKIEEKQEKNKNKINIKSKE